MILVGKVVSPGLAGEGTISLESVTQPGRFVRHRGGLIYVEEGNMDDQQFKSDCSWFAKGSHNEKNVFVFLTVVRQYGFDYLYTNNKQKVHFISIYILPQNISQE